MVKKSVLFSGRSMMFLGATLALFSSQLSGVIASRGSGWGQYSAELEHEDEMDPDTGLTSLRTHSLYVPYIDQDLQNRWYDFGGDAIVNTNEHIRLTTDQPSQTGWLWSRLPITAASFQIEFEFKVSGKSDGLFGDGFGVFLTKDRAEAGPVFGNRDHFEGLGIFFDTYANSRQSHSFPYVMAMMGDGRTSYDNAHDGLENRVGGCESDFRGRDISTKGRLTYSRSTGHLDFKIQANTWDQWEDCFTLTDIKLPQLPYLGFTAVTGEVHDNHDIISVTTSAMNTVAEEQHLPKRHNNTPPPRDHRSTFMWVLKFGAVAGVLGGVIMVVKAVQKKNDMKRF